MAEPVWYDLCKDDLTKFGFNSLQRLAAELGIQTRHKTKDQICDDLNREYAIQIRKVPHPECINRTTITSLNPWDEIASWRILKIVEGGKIFCFEGSDYEKLEPKYKNPYTGSTMPLAMRVSIDRQLDQYKSRSKYYHKWGAWGLVPRLQIGNEKPQLIPEMLADEKFSQDDYWFGAAENGYCNWVKDLVQHHGQNVNARNTSGSTALHIVLTSRNYFCVQTLIDLGINVNAGNRNGLTALALVRSDDPIATILMRAGAHR
jgi:hypothetical protein